MKRSGLKELLVTILWLITATFGYFFLAKHYGVTAEKIFFLAIAVIFELYIFFNCRDLNIFGTPLNTQKIHITEKFD